MVASTTMRTSAKHFKTTPNSGAASVKNDRTWLSSAYYVANFIYCDLGDDAAAVATRLQAEGVIVRPLGPWGAPTAIRITIGIPEQNDIFINAFRKVMDRASVR